MAPLHTNHLLYLKKKGIIFFLNQDPESELTKHSLKCTYTKQKRKYDLSIHLFFYLYCQTLPSILLPLLPNSSIYSSTSIARLFHLFYYLYCQTQTNTCIVCLSICVYVYYSIYIYLHIYILAGKLIIFLSVQFF